MSICRKPLAKPIRLERMQKERHKWSLDESPKRSQIWLTNQAIRNNRPQDIPARHPLLNEKSKCNSYPNGHPMYFPNDQDLPNDPDDPLSDNSDDTGAWR